MKYLKSWLREYYKTDKSVEQTGEDLVSLGLDVEEISPRGPDSVLELEITPNRGDLLSHFGLVRDLSAKAGQLLEKPKLELNEASEKTSDEIKVKIESDKCLLYLARVIKGAKIAPSPKWLQAKLIAVGAKPINNVVDATNYIMLDFGHPLHAFDAGKIIPLRQGYGGSSGSQVNTERKIIVREIKANEEVVTLDGEARELIEGMLVIADDERPVAIAGVMGLKNSEVDEGTKDIVLEAAVFDRKSVRKTAKLLNLKTEASARFERGVDADGVRYAIDKAAKMIAELAGGEILSGVARSSQQSEVGSRKLKIEYEKINSYASLSLEKEKINKILENLGFEIKGSEAQIPPWRHDIAIWQDLAEEIYRINGLEKISPEPLPEMQKAKPSDYYPTSPRQNGATRDEMGINYDTVFRKKEKIKDYLMELGLDEAISYTFLSDTDVVAAKLSSSDLLEVANPVQDENRYLRNSLIPGLLKAVAKNPSFDDIEFFEMGNVFTKTDEWTSLALATTGKSARKASEIVAELTKLGFDTKSIKTYEIDREELKRFKIKKPSVAVAEMDLGKALPKIEESDLDLKIDVKQTKYRPVSKFPPVKRDLAFVVGEGSSLNEIRDSILQTSPKAVLVEPFDEFASDRFGAGKKSVAFHIWLQDLDKTLSDSEAEAEISKIILSLKEKFDATLRD